MVTRGESRPRLLVTGAGGLLGGRLAELLDGAFEVVGTRLESAPPLGVRTVRVDLRDPAAALAVVSEERPVAVVHAAARARPDACETDPADAEAVNVGATRHLVGACRRVGTRLVFVSTDLVRGAGGVYVDTKRRAEHVVLAEPAGAVLRVALVVGRGHGGRPTASEAVVWALAAGGAPRLFEDEFRTPVDAGSVARAVEAVVHRNATGLFEIGGEERVSRLELGRRAAAAFGFDARALVRASRRDHPGASRPADVCLDLERAGRELDYRPTALEAAIRDGRPAPPAATSPGP